MSDCFAKMVVTVSCVVFGLTPREGLQICLIQRIKDPFSKLWALPGGYVMIEDRKTERIIDAAKRELKKDTGIENPRLFQFGFFEEEDYRMKTASGNEEKLITVGYYSLVDLQSEKLIDATKHKNATWFTLEKMPELAFDHKKLVESALQEMKRDIFFSPNLKHFLPQKFSLTEFQLVFEKLFDCNFDKSNFRKKILESKLLDSTPGEKKNDGLSRAAQLFFINTAKFSTAYAGIKVFALAGLISSLIKRKTRD